MLQRQVYGQVVAVNNETEKRPLTVLAHRQPFVQLHMPEYVMTT